MLAKSQHLGCFKGAKFKSSRRQLSILWEGLNSLSQCNCYRFRIIGYCFSTGEKTNNRALGVDINGQPIENITETLDRSGYVSSVISTSEVTHATPAAFVVHTSSRYLTDEISIQMTDSKIKNILGGGRKFFIPEEDGGNREDGINLIEKVKSKSTLITDKSELSNPARYGDNQVFGLFADEHLRDDSTQKITRQNRLLKGCLNSQSIDQKNL